MPPNLANIFIFVEMESHHAAQPGQHGETPALASQVAGITGSHHHAWLIFVFLVERAFYHVDQVDLELLTSQD